MPTLPISWPRIFESAVAISFILPFVQTPSSPSNTPREAAILQLTIKKNNPGKHIYRKLNGKEWQVLTVEMTLTNVSQNPVIFGWHSYPFAGNWKTICKARNFDFDTSVFRYSDHNVYQNIKLNPGQKIVSEYPMYKVPESSPKHPRFRMTFTPEAPIIYLDSDNGPVISLPEQFVSWNDVERMDWLKGYWKHRPVNRTYSSNEITL